MVLLWGTTDRLIDRRYYSMEMNVEKPDFKQLNQAQIVNRLKTTGECGIFQPFGYPGTYYARCTCEIKSRIAIVKAAINKKNTLFTRKHDLNLRNKLLKCYVWSKTLCVLKIGHFTKPI